MEQAQHALDPELCDIPRHGAWERYVVADAALDEIEKHGNPWRLSERLPDARGKGFSTPPVKPTER